MALFDIVIIFIVALLGIIGYIRGFIREIAELAGFIVGIILAIKFAMPLGSVLPPESWPLIIKTPLAAIVILIATIATFYIASIFIRKALIHGPMKFINRIMGAAFGALKGLVIIVIALLLLLMSPYSNKIDKWTESSPIAEALISIIEPTLNRYRGTITNIVSAKIFEFQLKDRSKPVSSKTQSEVSELVNKLSDAKTVQQQRNYIRKLSPEARRFLRDLARESREHVKDNKVSDQRWLSEQIPLDLVD